MEEMASIGRILQNKFGSDNLFCESNIYGMMCGFYNVKCSSLIPQLLPLKIQFSGDLNFNVPPEDYLIPDSSLGIDICNLAIMGLNTTSFAFGDNFLRSFISIYDFENKRVGLAPHIYSQGSITERN
jgi:hypothetical protein